MCFNKSEGFIMIRRVSFKSVILAGISFIFIYIFINFQVVIGLGDSLENAQPISEWSDFNKNQVHRRRDKNFLRRRSNDIELEYRISSKYPGKDAAVKKDKHDAAGRINGNHDAVMWTNDTQGAVVKTNDNREAILRRDDKEDVVKWTYDKHDTFTRKNNQNDVFKRNNDIQNAFLMTNDKHDSFEKKNDKQNTVTRSNDKYDSVRKRPLIGSLLSKHETNDSIVSKTTINPIKQMSKFIYGPIRGSINHPLQYIPTKLFPSQIMVPYISQNITKRFLWLPKQTYTQKIAIISPIRNSEWSLGMFKNQLVKLSYPRNLISVYFGESGSTDKTFEKAAKLLNILKSIYKFNDAAVINLKLSGGIQGPQRHDRVYQMYRRAHLAMARNRLVQAVLKKGKFDQILSIDSDLEEFPPDLVQQMLFAKSDVVVTPCLTRVGDRKNIYDCNSWKETKKSIHMQKGLSPGALVLECYGKTNRIFLPYLKHKGRVVKVDGVGGCALMVRADCFRSGLQFPEVVYKHHIETEGLAKMAIDMGFTVVGLPFVEVFHYLGAVNKTNT